MSKHTPGPWIFENRDGDHPLNDQNGWGCDGLWAVNGGFILGAGPGWDATYQNPTKANGRLIEAAPEMYEALQMFLAYNDQGGPLHFDTDAMWAKARSVVAKIEGGGNE